MKDYKVYYDGVEVAEFWKFEECLEYICNTTSNDVKLCSNDFKIYKIV